MQPTLHDILDPERTDREEAIAYVDTLGDVGFTLAMRLREVAIFAKNGRDWNGNAIDAGTLAGLRMALGYVAPQFEGTANRG